MGEVKIPNWLKKLPLAPEFHPTDTEFADPIAYISKIEKEASVFGICKVIPPLPKPSKKYIFSNLNKSLLKRPELGPSPSVSLSPRMGSGDIGNGEVRGVFTTRQQELGHDSRRSKGQGSVKQSAAHKQVWQSGEVYTLEQFESKSKAFAKDRLGMVKEVTPLVVEALFWKAASEKPIYIEYANDVPGSGFGEPEDLSQYFRKRRRKKFDQKYQAGDNHGPHETEDARNSYDGKKKDVLVKNDSYPSLEAPDGGSRTRRQKSSNGSMDTKGNAGWKLSNSPWNLQVIARSPGSLTRFMMGDIPGVTSPMIYIGMLFSWFAWHVEDHELHSLNFLHTGSPKTWYAVPGDYAFTFEEVIRSQGYGGDLDRLAALTLLGEKTNLLSPKVVVASGIPCCRLVQNPGEFVVTFPRAYHVGFSHGFNCGEAANFGTPQWLKVAKEAAVRRAAMDYLPMLSHQQLLYLLTMSFVSRVPRALIPGERTSRLKDRRKEERELLVKKAFMADMLNENKLVMLLLGKESTFAAVLWDPDLLETPSKIPESFDLSPAPDESLSLVGARNAEFCIPENTVFSVEHVQAEVLNLSNMSNERISVGSQSTGVRSDQVDPTRLYEGRLEDFCVDDDDLPCGLRVDSGTLACAACGILGFPFMSIIQPSQKASEELFAADCQTIRGLGGLKSGNPHSCLDLDEPNMKLLSDAHGDFSGNQDKKMGLTEAPNSGRDPRFMDDSLKKSFTYAVSSSSEATASINTTSSQYPMRPSPRSELKCSLFRSADASHSEVSKSPKFDSASKVYKTWNTSSGFLRPRVFCLEHALEIEALLHARGGANVLVICHSAYPKIKAHALAVAEEIGVPFNCDEVPLENASKEALDLIDISIEDEEKEEVGEDWTSRLGLNLRFCVKLRKLSQAKREHALALGGLFSAMNSGSDVLSIKWKSRRSRTSHKVTIRNQSKSNGSTQIKGVDIPVEKHERSKVARENIVLQYSRRKYKHEKVSPQASRIENTGNDFSELTSRMENTGNDFSGLTSRMENTGNDSSGLASRIENTRNDSSELAKSSTVNSERQHEECTNEETTDKMSEVSDPAKSVGSLLIKKAENDAAQLLRSSGVDCSEMQQDSTYEKTREVSSDTAKSRSPPVIETPESNYHKLTTVLTVENLKILSAARITGETEEKSETSDHANDAMMHAIESTGNDPVERFEISQEFCTTEETRIEVVFDRVKSAVLHAIHNSVLQTLKAQLSSQATKEMDIDERFERPREVCMTENDSEQFARSSNVFDYSEMQQGSTYEKTREASSDPANFLGPPAIENTESNSHKSTTTPTVESLEIQPAAQTTGETEEKSTDQNDVVLLAIESTGNDLVERFEISQEVCMTEETSIEVVFEHAKSAVLHAIHNLVLQTLDSQLKSQALKEIDIDERDDSFARVENFEMQVCTTEETRIEVVFEQAKSAVLHAIHNSVLQTSEAQLNSQALKEIEIDERDGNFATVENSEMQYETRTTYRELGRGFYCSKSRRLPAISTLPIRKLDAHIEDRTLKDEACNMVLDTFRMKQCNQTSKEEGRISDFADATCQPNLTVSTIESYEEQEILANEEVNMVPESSHTTIADHQPIKSARNKRKRGEEENNYDAFIRSPCEGLRPRTSRSSAQASGSGINNKVEVASKKARKPQAKDKKPKTPNGSERSPDGCAAIDQKKEENSNRVHICNVEGCRMSFKTKPELSMHIRNRCTHEGCRKKFSSHRNVVLHQKVHIDARPLKCSWKGCKMSFKWAWARTEHMRLHTGERPYQCNSDGCGRTFKFVSDYSRHRRKTGHCVNSPS